MRWRNDPTTRAMSFHTETKVWETFWPEFRDTYFSDDRLGPTFAVSDSDPVAFLRFQPVEDERRGRPAVGISINVDPQHRGRRYGVRSLLGAREHLRQLGIAACWAEIRLKNEVSQRAFASAGWELVEEIDKTVADTGEVCRIRRYVVSP